MRLPFTTDQFFDVFRRYNEAVWPAQWALLGLAGAAIALSLRGSSRDSRAVSGILTVLWLWMAGAYHLAFFSTINRAAIFFAAIFAVQALLFAVVGVWQGQLGFHLRRSLVGAIGALFIVYAILLYPGLGYMLGHRYPAVATFGLPCPTTIFTFGLLLWSDRAVPLSVIAIPAAWSLIGAVAALRLTVVEDSGLFAAGLVVTSLIVLRNRRLAGRAGLATGGARRVWRTHVRG